MNSTTCRLRFWRSLLGAGAIGVASLIAIACTPSPPGGELEDLVLIPGIPPSQIAGRTDISYFPNVVCGPAPGNRFDIVLPESDAPTALVVFVHGGGFTSGDKSSVATRFGTASFNKLLDNDIAVASVNYTYVTQTSEGVIVPLTDIQLCVQNMTAHAEQLGLDRTRVAYAGSSAGAGSSLWLGLADDRSDPGSPDPIAQESTVPLAIVGWGAQATYDLVRWADDIFAPFGLSLPALMAVDPAAANQLLGISDTEDMFTPEGIAYRDSVDMLDFINAGDPAVWIQNAYSPATIPMDKGAVNHHANHALFVKNAADAAGVENVIYIPALGIEDPSGENWDDFLIRKLTP